MSDGISTFHLNIFPFWGLQKPSTVPRIRDNKTFAKPCRCLTARECVSQDQLKDNILRKSDKCLWKRFQSKQTPPKPKNTLHSPPKNQSSGNVGDSERDLKWCFESVNTENLPLKRGRFWLGFFLDNLQKS